MAKKKIAPAASSPKHTQGKGSEQPPAKLTASAISKLSGHLLDKNPADRDRSGIDLGDQTLTPENLFGSATGSYYLDLCDKWFREGVYDIPWYIGEDSAAAASVELALSSEELPPSQSSPKRRRHTKKTGAAAGAVTQAPDKQRAYVRSEHSRPIQKPTMIKYQRRIIKESLSQLAAGEPIAKWMNEAQTFPVEAGTYNHRAAAFYAADATSGHLETVASVRRNGLTQVKVMQL
jgi:hypothetical protein